jgi:hypothetical protein
MPGIKRPMKSFKESTKSISPSVILLPEEKITYSDSRPVQCPFRFVTQYPCPLDPLTYETFMARRERNIREDGQIPSTPIPPLGSRASAPLLEASVKQSSANSTHRSNSPTQVHGITPIFFEERDQFIGRPRVSEGLQAVQPLLNSLSGFRSLHLLINFPGFVDSSPRVQLTSGFTSDDELVTGQPTRPFEPFSQFFSFTSRWEVDLFMSEAAFSVFVLVQGLQWLLVAPLQICHIIQKWSVKHNGDAPAIIRMHPNLSAAFSEIALAMAPDHQLVFLSPVDAPGEQAPGLSMKFFPDSLPEGLPAGPSEAFFPPVSMLVVPPHFDLDVSCEQRKFSALYTDYGNSPIRLRRLNGRREMFDFIPTGYSLILPFHEFDRQYKDSLIFALMMALPYYCWPCPAHNARQALDHMEPAFADRPHRVPSPSGDGGSV